MLVKICTKCGKKLHYGEYCRCQSERHKLYNRKIRDKEKNAFYQSKQWKSIVEKVKARANGLDEYALAQGFLEKGNTAHHIYPIEENPNLKLSLDNLIYVSARTHNKIHAKYSESQKQKEELQKKLLEIVQKKMTGKST